VDIVRELLLHYLGPLARSEIERRMKSASPQIMTGMIKKGMTPDHAPLDLIVHDALFRLWRSVIPSGDVSDLLRDLQDAKVKARVLPRINDGTDLAEIISQTRAALLEVTF
jgi:hypothetical protein